MSERNVFYDFTHMHFEQIKGPPTPPEKWQWRGTCPFCRKKDHFFFGATNEWDCKACMLKGNIYTFLKLVHEKLCDTSLVGVLAMERKIDVQYLVRNNVRWNPLISSFVLPSYNNKNNLNYLYRASKGSDGKYQIYNVTGLDATMLGWGDKLHQTVWLCEGLWDKYAAEDIIGNREISPLGFPGSNFKQSWCNAFAGKDLCIFTDNDEAGTKILNQILERIQTAPNKPESIKVIKWPTGLKPGFDVNDSLAENKYGAFDFLTSNLVEKEIQGATGFSSGYEIAADPTCRTYADLQSACSEVYYYTPDMNMLNILLISTVYALKIAGEQVWFRVIGPPGSSKTTLARIAGSSGQTVLQSTFTGLFSGWKDDDPTDASLIPKIAGKALIVKDADALLQQPNKDQIFSQLRDFYDKESSVTYMNRVSFEYHNVRSAFIFCGTHALRGIDNSALGERFLDFELTVTEMDREEIALRMMQRSMEVAISGGDPESSIHSKAKNFIDNELLNRTDVVLLNKTEQDYIMQQARLAAFMRAKVARTRTGEVAYKPFAEVPSRLVGQLSKLAFVIPVVIGESQVNDYTMQIMSRVVRDVIDANSNRYIISRFMCAAGFQSLPQLVEYTKLPQKVVERELDDMRELNMLDIKSVCIGANVSTHVACLKERLAEQMRLTIQG